MIPRGTLDIGWGDLLAALRFCVTRWDHRQEAARVERRWAAGDTLACLSVRSGFDLVLQALDLPAASEVLVSAVTIGDMPRILIHHGLVPVPVDLDPERLSVNAASLEAAITSRTRAVLVAHLFGSRAPLDDVVRLARRHELVVFEDCAQMYDASGYHGHPESDVSMFSFGPIKTATALGGALLRFKDQALLGRCRKLQGSYPSQARREFLQRVALCAALKGLAQPAAFGAFVAACRVYGIDYDRVIARSLRSFPGPDLLARIRRRPCAPLLALLGRRLRRPARTSITRRVALARALDAELPAHLRPGVRAMEHSHWMLPVCSRDPERLVRLLQAHGYDATRHASNMVVVAPATDRAADAPERALRTLAALLYLPVSPYLSEGDASRLACIVRQFEDRGGNGG